jgi:hypothetical protein
MPIFGLRPRGQQPPQGPAPGIGQPINLRERFAQQNDRTPSPPTARRPTGPVPGQSPVAGEATQPITQSPFDNSLADFSRRQEVRRGAEPLLSSEATLFGGSPFEEVFDAGTPAGDVRQFMEGMLNNPDAFKYVTPEMAAWLQYQQESDVQRLGEEDRSRALETVAGGFGSPIGQGVQQNTMDLLNNPQTIDETMLRRITGRFRDTLGLDLQRAERDLKDQMFQQGIGKDSPAFKSRVRELRDQATLNKAGGERDILIQQAERAKGDQFRALQAGLGVQGFQQGIRDRLAYILANTRRSPADLSPLITTAGMKTAQKGTSNESKILKKRADLLTSDDLKSLSSEGQAAVRTRIETAIRNMEQGFQRSGGGTSLTFGAFKGRSNNVIEAKLRDLREKLRQLGGRP